MKLSELVQEIQEFIAIKGDRDINSVEVHKTTFSASAMNLSDVYLISDGRKAVIQFHDME